ncbi:MAG: type II secretion system protein GspM [Nitrospiria bacterium]
MKRSGLLSGIDRFLKRLSPRERWVLGGGGVVVLLLIGYATLLAPAWERMMLLDRLIPRKENEVREFARLREDYLVVSQGIQEIERRFPTQDQFSPLSFLEENAARNQIRGNIAFIRPLSPQVHEPYREILVEVKVENVTLARIIPFLSAIETAPYALRIKRLAVKTRFADPSFMDVTFLVSSYEKDVS